MIPSEQIDTSPYAFEYRSRSSSRLRVVLGATVGTMLEYYDFAVYAYVATFISRNFFQGQSSAEALLSTFLTFGIGYVARPLGGLIVGYLADRKGRKLALLVTLFSMAIATALIGVLPTYRSIGLMAPVLLVVARCAQGFSAGGEAGSSMSFIVEWSPEGKRGLWGSFQQVGMMTGLLLGSAVVALLNTTLSVESMNAWGWRVPFLLGGLIGPFGMLMRRSLAETPAFEAQRSRAALASASSQASRVPVSRRTREWPTFVNMIVFPIGSVAAFYLLFVFMPVWMQRFEKVSPSDSLWANSIGLLTIVVTTPLMGAWSDRIGRKPVLLGSLIALLVVPYSLLYLLDHLQAIRFGSLVAMQIVLGAIVGAACGPFPAVMAEQFRTSRRSTWLNMVIALTTSAAGGFAPFIAVWLIARTGSPLAHMFFLIAAVLVSLPTLLFIKESAFSPLED